MEQMDRSQVLNLAGKRFDPALRDIKSSVFGSIGALMASIDNENIDDQAKRRKLTEALAAIVNSPLESIDGNPQPKMAELINKVFNLRNNKISNPDLAPEKMSYHDMHLYFRYMERQARSTVDLKAYFRQEEQAAKERHQAEQIREKELANQELEQCLAAMNELDRKIYDIENAPDEQGPTKVFQELDNFSDAEKPAIAAALKNYWVKIDKWEGNLTKKQQAKVAKVKDILKGRE